MRVLHGPGGSLEVPSYAREGWTGPPGRAAGPLDRRVLTFNQMVERLTKTYDAISHPIRRLMLESLKPESLRVTDLAQPFNVSLAAVSKHIRVLEEAGLISRTKRGREHLLTLDARPLVDAGAWIDTYQHFWEERLDRLEAYLGSYRERR